MECEWKQGQYHRAKIIERRKRSDAPDYEYYVHYIGCEFRTLFPSLPVMLLQHSRHAPSLHLLEWIAVYDVNGFDCAMQAVLGSLLLHLSTISLYIAVANPAVMVSH